MNNIYRMVMLALVLSALFFTEPAQKADIGTKQERYEKASTFLSEFGYTAQEISQILNTTKEQ